MTWFDDLPDWLIDISVYVSRAHVDMFEGFLVVAAIALITVTPTVLVILCMTGIAGL